MPAVGTNGVRIAVADILSLLESNRLFTTQDLERVIEIHEGASSEFSGANGRLFVEPLGFSELGLTGVHFRYSSLQGGLPPVHVYLENNPGKSSLAVTYKKGDEFLEGFSKGPFGYQRKDLPSAELSDAVKELGKLQ